MKTKIKCSLFGLIALLITAKEIYAANPSTTAVSVTIPALVQISGLSNIVLAPTNFSSAITGSTTACIYTNVITPLGSYYVTASSLNNSSGAFRVKNGSNFITYTAFWNATSAPTQTTTLTSGVKTVQQSGGNSSSLTCSATPNANFNIRLTNLQVAGAPPAAYTDTITLVVSPS